MLFETSSIWNSFVRLRSIYGVCVLRVGLSDVATCFGILFSAEESLPGVDISRGSEHCFAASRSKTRIVKSAGASVLPDICASISRWVYTHTGYIPTWKLMQMQFRFRCACRKNEHLISLRAQHECRGTRVGSIARPNGSEDLGAAGSAVP